MKSVLVRYTTTPEHADANEALVRAVFEELRATAPGGLRYASYRLADGVTFVHVATHELPNPLLASPAFRAFQAKLSERCAQPPVATEMALIASYAAID